MQYNVQEIKDNSIPNPRDEEKPVKETKKKSCKTHLQNTISCSIGVFFNECKTPFQTIKHIPIPNMRNKENSLQEIKKKRKEKDEIHL